jgi:hypothetical protein
LGLASMRGAPVVVQPWRTFASRANTAAVSLDEPARAAVPRRSGGGSTSSGTSRTALAPDRLRRARWPFTVAPGRDPADPVGFAADDPPRSDPVAWRGSWRAPNGRRYRVEACEGHRPPWTRAATPPPSLAAGRPGGRPGAGTPGRPATRPHQPRARSSPRSQPRRRAAPRREGTAGLWSSVVDEAPDKGSCALPAQWVARPRGMLRSSRRPWSSRWSSGRSNGTVLDPSGSTRHPR